MQLSYQKLDKHTVQSKYKAGYGYYIVTSSFKGDISLCDLLYDLILKKQEINFRSENSVYITIP